MKKTKDFNFRSRNFNLSKSFPSLRLPIFLMVVVLALFLIFFSVSQYKEHWGNLRRHVQVQIDGVTMLASIMKKTHPLSPSDMWDSVRGFPDISEAIVTSSSGEILGHFVNHDADYSWPILPRSWQFMKVRSSPIQKAVDVDSMTVILNLSQLHFSLLAVLMSIGGFAAILLMGASRLSKTSKEHVEAIVEEIEEFSSTDVLTGLPNRLGLEKKLGIIKNNFIEKESNFYIFLLNLDNFKLTNDALGYEAGDRILVQTAIRLKNIELQNKFVARMGADEFALIANEKDLTMNVEEFCQFLIDEMKVGMEVGGVLVEIGASVGVVKGDSSEMVIDALKAYAEAALYQAKRDGKNNFHLFPVGSAYEFHERVALHAMMRQAISNREFFMVYQPILDLNTMKITSFESLARWRHPEKGLIMPGLFMPVAEESGMIIEIGEIALQEACSDLLWLGKRMNTDSLSIAVNLSIGQLKKKKATEKLHSIVLKSSLNMNKIQFEVTESALMDSVQSSGQDLDRLKDMGYALSIDDFGTGYSSLARLKEVDVKKLKIDRGFITNIDKDNANQAIVTAVVQMAHSLGMRVVAEGVENEDEARIVKLLGCDEMQGYLISRPVTMNEIYPLVTDWNNRKENLSWS